ncbi:unnamed protein product [Porites evermanni]|uniref:ABC transporter domain-containing protein n=1 Tax=Porites evermanni TaxID=104178 RepID=A0ABN8QD43_9CNID|nr:unnamed protein product [Porites evermanni]
MARANQFSLLMWKNFILLKRAPVRTFFQIAMPLLFIAILVFHRAFKIKNEYKPNVTYPAFEVNKLPSDVSKLNQIAFAPNTSDVRQVMVGVVKQLGFTCNSSVPFNSEEDMVSSLVSLQGNETTFLGGIAFNTSLDSNNIIYKIRLSSKTNIKQNGGKEERQGFGTSPSTTWNTQFTFPVLQVPGPRNKNAFHGGPPFYFEAGFLAIQHAVDVAIMKYRSKGKTDVLNTTVSIKRFPYPDYTHDNFVQVIQTSFPLFFMLSLSFIVLIIVRDVVYEKEKKLKESMKMMGLSGWLHWLAWFTKYLLLLLIIMAFATLFFTVKFNSNGRVLNKTSPTVLFVFLMLYAVSSIMFCFCVSVFFSKANIAAAAGGIIWVCNYIPYFFVAQYYDTMSVGAKAASCLLSNVAMSMGAQLIGKFEGAGIGSQWSNLNQGPSIDDDFTLGLVMVMFVVDSLIYGLIAWYVQAVFPGDFGVPQPWYFPVLPSYWCGKGEEVEIKEFHDLENGSSQTGTSVPEFLEKEPVGLVPGIEIKKLKKVFSTEKGKKVAVNGVSLNMYEGQITALLGQNGAGKTTLMSMLTGLFPASSGSALVNGCSIRNNIRGVRSSLGLCPQHDVLYDHLTVEEHLWFFAKLKNCPSHRVRQEVNRMIECLGLADKRHTQTRALSGGMKRKLSVGIALISDSKVVMLDEPTSGMDPSARRFTWDLLQQQKQGRTILLTTHFTDEADILGDRIAIMAEGNIKCCGSSFFLKNKYGVGYHLVMVKEPHCDVSKIISVVSGHVPTAMLESNVAGAELSFVLPSEATDKFEGLFLELENRRQELGIASYGASVTTLEEVFFKVLSTLSDKLQKRDQEVNVTAWFNNQAYHAIAVSLAAADGGILRSVLGKNVSMTTVNHPLPRTAQESINDLQRNILGFQISSSVLVCMTFLASSFVVFLVQERANKAKHVQFVSGVDPFSYWGSAYTWDLINFLLLSLSILILVAACDVPAYTGPRLGYLFMLLMLYGWAIIPLMYLFSFVFRNASTANVVLTMFNVITGQACLLTVFDLSIPELDLLDVPNALKWAFLVLPNYCLGQGLFDIFDNYNALDFFNKALDRCLHTKAECEKLIREYGGSQLEFQENYLSWDNPGIGRFLVFLALEGIVFYALVLLTEYGVFNRLTGIFRCSFSTVGLRSEESSVSDDDDVLEEKRRVMSSENMDDVLAIKELTKVFSGNGCEYNSRVMGSSLSDIFKPLLPSGGNKRKLSTAISLVGDPPVVFLDEPTTGMDPVARRLVWDALSRVRADGRCIVITSHSTEECEALCTRLAIMVNGRLKCLGSPQHLKHKFGEGYTLLARVSSNTPDTAPLKQFIESSFPGSVLKDEHQGMVHYHIPDTSITWAQLFGAIERVKLNFNIEDYSVSQTTLDQVFLNFARGQREEDN